MNKKQLVAISLSTIMTLGVTITALCSGNLKSPYVVAESTDRVLIINDSEDEENHLIDENQATAVEKQTTIYTTLHNPIKINSSVVYLSANKSMYMNKNNYVANDYTSPIGSMKSITITGSSQAFTLYYGWDDGEGGIDYHISTSFRAYPYGGTFQFSAPYPSYFKVIASGTSGMNVYEISITYADDCENIPNPYVTVDGMNYMKTGANTVSVTGLVEPAVNSVTIPDVVVIDGVTYKVTAVGDKAFYDNDYITSVALGANIDTIGAFAFDGCYRLTTVTNGSNVKYVREYAFESCPFLSTLQGFDNVEAIERYGFEACSALTTFNFSSELKSIGNAAFMSTGLTGDVVLPEGLTRVESAAFRNSKISSISIPASCRDFFDDLIYTSQLETITVHEDNPNYKAVDNVLYNKAMTRIIRIATKKTGTFVIPDSVTEVADYGAEKCYLSKIVFNNKITRVPQSFMQNSLELSEIVLGSKITKIENYAFSNCQKLTTLTIPGTVKTICGHAFAFNNFTNVTLEEGVETIYCRAFKDSTVEAFYMPKSVTSIAVTDEYNSWEPAFTKEVTFYFADTEEEAAAKTNWHEGWAGTKATFNYAA